MFPVTGVVGHAAAASATAAVRDTDRNSGASGRRILLGNGLEVLLLPDPGSRLVTCITVVRAGSAAETPELSGASHFLEHMLFNGTERRSQAELYDEVDFYAAFNNAFTRRTHAAFMTSLPASFLGRGLDIQSDMLFHSTLAPEKFEKERGIILEEMAKDRESETYALERLLDAETYPASSYGLPILGSEASIGRLSRDRVWEFYRRFYRPERMTLMLLGGFDPISVVDTLEHTFGAISATYAPREAPPAPGPIVADRVTRHLLELSRDRLRMVWNAPPPEAPSHLAVEAAVELLLGDDSRPIAAAIQRDFPGLIQAWGAHVEAGAGFGRIVLDVDLQAGSPLDSIRAAIRQALSLQAPPTTDDLHAWKIGLRAAQLSGLQRSYMFAPLCSEEIAVRGGWGFETRLARADALAEVAAADFVATWRESPCWAILVSAAPTDETGSSALSTFPEATREPSPLTATTETDTVLANGGRLLLLPAAPGGLLGVYLLFEGRNYLEPPGKEGVAELLHECLELGPRDMDEASFARALGAVGGELQAADRAFLPFDDYYTRPDFSFVRFQALEEHAESAFALLAETLRRPRLSADVLERLRGRRLSRLGRERSSGGPLARSELAALLYGRGHPEARSPYGNAASIASITAADLEQFHQQWLDGRRVWIGVASSLPPETVAALAEELLPPAATGGLPTAEGVPPGLSAERAALWRERDALGQLAESRLRGRDPADTLIVEAGLERGHVLEAVLVPLSAQAPAEAAAPDGGSSASDLAALRVATEVLSSRLAFRLREEQGLAYGIGAALERIGDHLLYVAAAGTRPQNIAAMARGMKGIRTAATTLVDSREARRCAHALYGTFLRRQESRLNQAMFAVWSARTHGLASAWRGEAETLEDVSTQAVAGAVSLLAHEDASVLVIAR